MFDIGWTELLIFAVVTLIFVGPNELPVLMRTVGRYFGMVRQQADEFRRHFDAAMQEAEFDRVRAELDAVGDDLSSAVQEGRSSLAVDKPDMGEHVNTDHLLQGSTPDASKTGPKDIAGDSGRGKDRA